MEPPPSLRDPSLETTIREMDEAGVDIGVIPARRSSGALGDVGNDDIRETVRAHPDRFVGFGAPDLVDVRTALEELDDFAAAPEFAGIVVEPGLWPLPLRGDDRRLYPIYEKAQALGLPLLIMGGGNAGPDVEYTSATIVDHICVDFPQLTVIAAHGGWPWVHQTLHVAFRRPNLVVSPDMYLFGMAGWRDYVDAANGYLSDRFLFASAYPFIALDRAVAGFRELVDDSVADALLGGNAQRLLGLRDRRADTSAVAS